MHVSILRALRIVIRADSDPARQALFANLRQSHLSVRVVYAAHERLGRTGASALLMSCYGLAFFLSIARPGNRSARVLAVARHANARRRVDRVAVWLGPGECERIDVRLAVFDGLAALAGAVRRPARSRFRRAFRIVAAIDRRHGFLVAGRAAAALAWYARGFAMLRADPPKAVLVSSDSNPEELGFASAARALDVPTVFISHAYPTPLSPRLDFSLSILEGEAEIRARARKGSIKGAVVLAGLEGDSAPIDIRRFEQPNPVIGIFTPKGVSWPTFAAIVADCRQHFSARRILVRWHPSMLERPRLGQVLHDAAGVEETPRTANLADVARQCDWVVADENSGVHLPVLKLGIPTVAVRNLGLYPKSRSDLYGFVANRVIPAPVASVCDARADVLAAFFNSEWADRFAQYDAAYLRPQKTVAHEVRSAIWRAYDHASVNVTCA